MGGCPPGAPVALRKRGTMLRAALRDLQWRRRRFVIAVLGAGLVFAVSLVGSGISQSFRVEIDRTIAPARAARWVTPPPASGPSPAARLFPQSVTAQVAALPGVQQASPLVFGRTVVDIPQ